MADATARLRPEAGPRASTLVFEILGVATLTLLLQLPIFDRWFSIMDEGHHLLFADMVRNGAHIHADATSYPLPGAFWLLAGLFETFGASMRVSRWMVALEFALFVGLLFGFLRRLVPATWAWTGAFCLLAYRAWAFPHWQMYSYSTTSLLVLIVASLALLAALEQGNHRWIGFAGLLYGLGVLCKQDYGAAFLLTFIALLAIHARVDPARPRFARLLASFLLPAAVVGLATGLYHAWHGILDILIQQTVLNHFVGIQAYDYSTFPSLWPLFERDPALRTRLGTATMMPALMVTVDWPDVNSHPLFVNGFWFELGVKAFVFGPIPIVALGLARLVFTRDRLAEAGSRAVWMREAWLVFAASFLLLLVFLNRPQDYVHLAVLYWPILLISIVLLAALVRSRPWLGLVSTALIAIPVLAASLYGFQLLDQLRRQYDTPLPSERAGVYVQPDEARLFDELLDTIHARIAPGQPLTVLPYFPLLNFLADRPGIHPSAYILWPFPEIPDRDAQIVRTLREEDVDFVVYHFTQFISFPPVRDYAPLLFRHLVDHYEIERILAFEPLGYRVATLRRTKTPSYGESLLDRGDHRILRRWPGGRPRPVRPDAIDDFFGRELWPFRPVFTLRPTAEEGATLLRLPLRVPSGSPGLETSIAVHPQRWFELPPSDIRFAIRAVPRAPQLGSPEILFERTLSPTLDVEDRGWFDVRLDLSAWAGRRIWLDFINQSSAPSGESRMMAGWGEPRLITGPFTPTISGPFPPTSIP